MAGTLTRPTSCAARNLRSPAMSSNRVPARRTISGWMMPCCRIESVSSCNASRPKSFRGWNVLGTMFARLIWCTISPDSATSVRAVTVGVPNQRAKTFTQTRSCHAPQANGTALSRQTAIPATVLRLDFSQLGWASNRPVSKGNLTKRGPLKKTLTFESQIWYQREWLHNREEFLPGKFLSVRNPVN